MADLVVEHLAHAYGERIVLVDINFQLASGEIACLLGASGCGKTTLLNLIAGFENLQAGQIRINDEVVGSPMYGLPVERRKIGFVFQDYALFPHLTAADNIGFGLTRLTRQEKRLRIQQLLDLMGLTLSAHLYPHQLSGGQQQRIALARALAPRPQLLLLDEPFSNLDVDLRERLAMELRDILKAEHTTTIFVTHDQSEAFVVADVIGVMNAGQIAQWDTPYNAYHRPTNRFVADFIGQGTFIPGRIVNGHLVHIELGMTETALPLASALPSTDSVAGYCDVLLRPDDIVHDDASPLTAQVVRKAFRGANFLYTLQLDSGQSVLSLVPSHHDHPIGEKIGIRLQADHVVAFSHNTITRKT